MNIFTKTAVKLYNHTKIFWRRNGSNIGMGVGIVSVIGGTILIGIASSKVEAKVKAREDELNDIQKKADEAELTVDPRLIRNTKGKMVLDIVKLFGPGVALEAFGIGCMAKAYIYVKKENKELVEVATVLGNALAATRKRNKELLGEQKELMARYPIEKKDVEIFEESEDGKVKSEKVKNAMTVDPEEFTKTDWSRIFDETCPGWTKDPWLNKTTILKAQEEANHILQERGYLFLNEVYDFECFKFDKTLFGNKMGWVNEPDEFGKMPVVDFGIFDVANPQKNKFVNGYERSVLLDFNIDPKPIIDRVFRRKV